MRQSSDETAAAEYALGTLDGEGRRKVAAAAAEGGPMAALVDAWERRLATLAPGVPAIAPPAGLLEKIRRRIRDDGAGAMPGTRTVRAGAEGWAVIAAGIERKLLAADPAEGVHTYLLRLAPGAVVPAHGHPQPEECFVVEGSIMIGDLALDAGDFHFAAAGAAHPAVSSGPGAVVYVRAARSDDPPA
jgi:quercetin dioxygenase-like cupin family protein